MPNARLFLFLALLTVGYLLWTQWQLDYGPGRPAAGPESATAEAPAGGVATPGEVPPADLPSPPPDSGVLEAAPAAAPSEEDEAGVVHVRTDVLDAELSLRGGTLEAALLLSYPVAVDRPDQPVQLLAPRDPGFNVAQTGLLSEDSPAPNHTQRFSAEAREFTLADGQDELVVPLTWRQNGVTVIREYVFRRGDYLIDVRDRIINQSGRAWVGQAYRQLQRGPLVDTGGNSFTNPGRFSFTGPAFFTPEGKYEKFDLDELDTSPEQARSAGAWIAMVQHYFLTAWVPPAEQEHQIQLARISGAQRWVARAFSPRLSVPDGGEGAFEAALFVGPKLQDRLDDIAPGLALTVDYGIFTPFSKVLFWLLDRIHDLVGNWGWAIVLLTVLVKAIFFKLTEAQYKSMAKLRKLQPRIAALKERYGDDKQKFNMKMMEIYRDEKVNPLGGCLPVLIQIPVFIALYWVLVESVELRQAPFMLWLNDLSSPDPYFILPIINGAAMFMTTKLSPNPAADPIQQKIMLSMPIVFSVMFAFFQAGLVLYWAVNAVLSLAQQWVITRRIDAQG